MQSGEDIRNNLRQGLLLLESVPEDTKLVILPENCLFFRIHRNSPMKTFSSESTEIAELQRFVDQRSIYLILGSVPWHETQGPTNAMILLAPGVAPQTVYRKIHLFDVDVDGEKPQRESDVFAPGSEPATIDILGWKLGLSICYDLRFAELYLHYARAECDAILVPSAFLVTTGKAHWHTLIRARAIESQAYVLAPAQAGRHVSGSMSRLTYGHSLIADPWGEILVEGNSDRPEVLSTRLELSRLKKVRSAIPMARHRRL